MSDHGNHDDPVVIVLFGGVCSKKKKREKREKKRNKEKQKKQKKQKKQDETNR